jgi:hypothetical protein
LGQKPGARKMWAEVSETWDNIARETKIAAETARLQAEILYFESEAACWCN